MLNSTFKNNLLFFILLIPFLSFSQYFSLAGTYEGSATDELLFGYIDTDENYKLDTLKIVDKEFKTSGTLNGVQFVKIYGTPNPKGMEDPNLGYFFIEPGEIKIQVEENKFKEIKVTGSQTQKEFESIFKKTYSMHQEINNILESQADDARELVQTKLEKVKEMELQFAYKNPGSYVSPYYVNFYKTVIPADSVVIFYNNFPQEIKGSMSAEAINT